MNSHFRSYHVDYKAYEALMKKVEICELVSSVISFTLVAIFLTIFFRIILYWPWFGEDGGRHLFKRMITVTFICCMPIYYLPRLVCKRFCRRYLKQARAIVH